MVTNGCHISNALVVCTGVLQAGMPSMARFHNLISGQSGYKFRYRIIYIKK